MAALLILIAVGHHYVDVGTNAVSRPSSSDFYKFYLSAERVRTGHSMYWLVPPRARQGDACHPDTPDDVRALAMPLPGRLTLGGELPCLGPNLNPPIFTAVMLPLSLLPYGDAWWIWAGFSAICAVFSVWLLTGSKRRATGERFFWTLLGSAALFAYYPTMASFSLGQLGGLLLPLVTMSWLDLRQAKNMRSGLWLGLAIGIKPFLGVLLLGLLLLGNWKTLLTATCTLLGLFTLGAMIFGLGAYQDYALLAGNVSWTASNWNGSWFGLFDRCFSGQADANWPANKPLSQALGTAFALMTLGFGAWLTYRRYRQTVTSRADALFAVGLPACLLASPLGWMYYFPWLLPSVFIVWHQTATGPHGRPRRLGLSMFVIMTSIPIGLKPVPTPLNPTVWYGLDAWYFHALIVLLAVVMVSAAQKRTAP